MLVPLQGRPTLLLRRVLVVRWRGWRALRSMLAQFFDYVAPDLTPCEAVESSQSAMYPAAMVESWSAWCPIWRHPATEKRGTSLHWAKTIDITSPIRLSYCFAEWWQTCFRCKLESLYIYIYILIHDCTDFGNSLMSECRCCFGGVEVDS